MFLKFNNVLDEIQVMTEKDRDDILFMAKLAEQGNRYQDMKTYMNQVVTMGSGAEPSYEERHLFHID